MLREIYFVFKKVLVDSTAAALWRLITRIQMCKSVSSQSDGSKTQPADCRNRKVAANRNLVVVAVFLVHNKIISKTYPKKFTRDLNQKSGNVCVCFQLLKDVRGIVATTPLALRWNARFTTNGMRAKENAIYVARTSNDRVISSGELYCCLLPQCELYVHAAWAFRSQQHLFHWQWKAILTDLYQ